MKDTSSYNHQKIESELQKKWEKEKLFSPDFNSQSLEYASKSPFYNLMMFPYPSAEGLHVGNMYAFTGADVYARFNRMHGKDVFEPIGLDGFGIHSENYALKVGRHPKEQAKISQENYYRQLRSIGNSFDWERTLETYDPDYYRWTQWLFIKLFQSGLAYRKKAKVNFCPSCKTVLSDEQVLQKSKIKNQKSKNGSDEEIEITLKVCERCDTEVEKKDLEQWFFKITKYADRLLTNIEKLDWTEKVKIAQKNWIGRKEGTVITFEVADDSTKISVFTTRPDTLFGATFLVISPEHPFVDSLLRAGSQKEIAEYIEAARNTSKDDRAIDDKEKTGVFSGLYVVNPVNKEKLPIWIADYVLMSYGTGAIMAVPAHDQRDFEFAKKYKLPIKHVIKPTGSVVASPDSAYTGEGRLINSEEWNGWDMPEMMHKVIDWLGKKGIGKKEANYHLRDWLISRQRYWGPPIPMIFCDTCAINRIGENPEMPGWHTVAEKDLPVLLPDVEDWKPMGTGLSPLANHPEFYNVTCPHCGSSAKRETDVSDTFLDSAWYFLRYTSTDIENSAFDTDRVKKWLPVNKYIGGAEHSVLHLLYSRFISMVLYDLKLTHFEEPFESFFAHGLIIKDGAKMSKSKGNVVVPDQYIEKYGADTLRAYLMFLGPFSDGGDFRDSGIEGMNRFVKRVWKKLSDAEEFEMSDEGKKIMHKTIKKVTEDIGVFKYNTAISGLMEWYNFFADHEKVSKVEAEVFLKLFAPFSPFLTDELWQRMGNKNSIHLSEWPEYDEKYLVSDEVVVVIQVNGKKRSQFTVDSSRLKDKEKLEVEAKELISKYLEGATVKKVVYVPGKIINFVL